MIPWTNLEPAPLAALHSWHEDILLKVEPDQALPLVLPGQRELNHLVQPDTTHASISINHQNNAIYSFQNMPGLFSWDADTGTR